MFKVSIQKGCGDGGCHGGVAMDDDTYFEGYERDVIYPPCRCHPKFCVTCCGTGIAPDDIAVCQSSDDCPDCESGWRGDGPEHPDHRYSDPEQWEQDMAEIAAEADAALANVTPAGSA